MKAQILSIAAFAAIVAVPMATQAQFNVQAYNVVGGGGSNDNDLDGAGESLNIWNVIDAGQGTGTAAAFGTTYNIANIHTDTNSVIDFSGGGNFGTNNPYTDISGGAGLGGDDFSVRALANVTFAPGTYTIGVGSDDGRYLQLAGADLTAVGGQGGTQQIASDKLAFFGTTGHDYSVAQFTVAAPTTFVLDTHMFERGGGDSMEVAIAAGAQADFNGSFELLTDGSLSGAVSVAPATAADIPQPGGIDPASVTPGFNVRAWNIIGGGGSTDNDLNNTTETAGIWNFLQNTDPNFTTGTTPSIGGQVYNIETNHVGTATEIDFAGGGGNFNINNAYSTIDGSGTGLGGDDFSVGAQTFLAVPEGTWTLSVASDDGRLLTIDSETGILFDAAGGQLDLGGAGFNFIGENDTTGHDHTVGTFTVDPSDFLEGTDFAIIDLEAFFFERGGGDSFEISIAPGQHGDFNENFALLADGAFGVGVSSTAPSAVPEPATIAVWTLLGLAGFGYYIRRKRSK